MVVRFKKHDTFYKNIALNFIIIVICMYITRTQINVRSFTINLFLYKEYKSE